MTIQDLAEHAAGLPARLLDRPPAGRREFEHEICVTPLEYPPRTRSIYSDLGFILLGFALEDRGSAALSRQFDSLTARLFASPQIAETGWCLAFAVPPELRAPDPHGDRAAQLAERSLAEPLAFLELEEVFTPRLRESERFRATFAEAAADLAKRGPIGAIESVLA